MGHAAVAATCAGIFAAHIWLGWLTCDWAWVTRSGTLVVATGILLESWLILKTPRADDMPAWTNQPGHTAIRVAIVIVCIGTIVQGYGDLPFRLLRRCR